MEDRSSRESRRSGCDCFIEESELKDQELEELLRAPFGFTDEQLERELEESEKNVNDVDFSGAEDRMFRKLMERKAAKTVNSAHGKSTLENARRIRLRRNAFRVVLVAAIFVGMLGFIAVG